MNPDFQLHDLKMIVIEIELLEANIARNKNIKLQNNIDTDIYVSCDIEMTKSILRNLVSNAIKITKPEGIPGLFSKILLLKLIYQILELELRKKELKICSK